MIKLNDSGILFNQKPRYYYEAGKIYKGITGTLINKLFPFVYDKIPKHILEKACKRGNRIHADLTTYDVLGMARSEEAKWWAEIVEKEGLTVLANEYIVSDRENYASPIDKVAHRKGDKPNEVILIDVKATYKFMEENVRWQTNVYRIWFEKLNPHLTVKGIYCLHVKDRARLHELEFIPKETIGRLVESTNNGYEFVNPYIPITEKTDKAVEFAKKLVTVGSVITELEKEANYHKESLDLMLEEIGQNEWERDKFIAIFETAHPELKGKYKKLN